MTLEVAKITGETWTIVLQDGEEVFRASTKGFNRKTRKECADHIASRKYTLDFYKASAAKFNEMQEWIQARPKSSPGTKFKVTRQYARR